VGEMPKGWANWNVINIWVKKIAQPPGRRKRKRKYAAKQKVIGWPDYTGKKTWTTPPGGLEDSGKNSNVMEPG